MREMLCMVSFMRNSHKVKWIKHDASIEIVARAHVNNATFWRRGDSYACGRKVLRSYV